MKVNIVHQMKLLSGVSVNYGALVLKRPSGSHRLCTQERLNRALWSREGQGEERKGSGARRRQEEIHHRVTSLTAPSSDSSPTNAPPPPGTLGPTRAPDQIACRETETGDDHGESPPPVPTAAGRHTLRVPRHINVPDAVAATRESLRPSPAGPGVMTGLPTVARRPARTLDPRSVHVKHRRPITTFLRGLK